MIAAASSICAVALLGVEFNAKASSVEIGLRGARQRFRCPSNRGCSASDT